MSRISSCPDVAAYAQLVHGRPVPNRQELLEHLEHCPHCRLAVRSLGGQSAGDAGVTAALEVAGEGEAVPVERSTLSTVGAASEASEVARSHAASHTELLRPSQAPDEIGRL